MLSLVDPEFGYDNNGNLTNDSEFVYKYDLANRLTNVIERATSNSVLSARYDGLGRRVEVVRNGTTTERYVYLPGSFLVLAVLDGSNNLKEVYTHGPDLSGAVGGAGGIGGILSVSTNVGVDTASHYLHPDAMGNTVLAIGYEGKQTAAYGYTPYGQLVSQVGQYQARFLFSSKELDPQTGLTLYGLRYFNPANGTWLTRDHIGERGGINLYQFANNSPVNFVDPWGLRTLGEIINRQEYHPYTKLEFELLDKQTIDKFLEKAYVELQSKNCRSQGGFDTGFFDGYEYDIMWQLENGRLWRGDDLNYMGIGMFNAAHNRSIDTAINISKLWKKFMWNDEFTTDQEMALRLGYEWYQRRHQRENLNNNGGI